MKKIIQFILILCVQLWSCFAIGQDAVPGIKMINHYKENSIEFLEQGRRIKVIAYDDERIVGNFKIIDSKTIQIDTIKIMLSDIKGIRKASTASAILEPLAYIYGTLSVAAGTAAIILDPTFFGSIFFVAGLITGAPLILIPALKRTFKPEGYTFEIQTQQEIDASTVKNNVNTSP